VIYNAFSLLTLQGLNYLLPLLTMPYLLRVIGVDKVGLLAFATATAAYFQVLADYGFTMSATRAVAIHRDDKEKLGEICSSVWIIQAVLILAGFTVICILVVLVERLRQNANIFMFAFGVVVGHALFPSWFFQGVEKMKYMTGLNMGSKAIYAIAIFVFVKNETDFYLVPIITAVGGATNTTISLAIISRIFGVKFRLQNRESLKVYIKDGWYVFTSRLYLNLYMSTNIVLLGLLTNNAIVGYYSVSEKIVGAICSLFDSANQALYPYFANLHGKGDKGLLVLTNKVAVYFLAASTVIVGIGLLSKDMIIVLVVGKSNTNVALIFSILLLTLFARPIGTLFSNVLIVLDLGKVLNSVMKNTAILSLITAPCAIYFFQGTGLAVVAVGLVSFAALCCRRSVLFSRGKYDTAFVN
jgi:polysaccharide transporter, PST family